MEEHEQLFIIIMNYFITSLIINEIMNYNISKQVFTKF